jgi:hypothetical protein
MQECRITYTKAGKKWTESARTYSASVVKDFLLSDLIAKKINKCTYIKSIKKVCLYNGFNRFIVYYDNGVKSEYIIKRV